MRDILVQSIDRLLADHCTPQLLRDSENGGYPTGLWELIEESGFALAAVSEDAGGAGLPWGDIYPLVQRMGLHALPLPLPETLLAAWLLDTAGLPFAEGAVTVGDGVCQGVRAAPADNGQLRLSGTVAFVPWGRHCEHMVVDATDAEGHTWIALVARADVVVHHDLNIAREPRDTWVLEAVTPVACARWADPHCPAPVRTYGAMVRSAQMAGAMERIVQLSVQYAGERVQFGKPISKFQAIQHQLACAGCESAATGAGAAFAFGRVRSPGQMLAIASAKLRANEASGPVASIGHGTHGAIGFTYEHHLHFLTRRLWSWRSEFGNALWWSTQIGESVCTAALPFWEQITDTGHEHLRLSPTLSLDRT